MSKADYVEGTLVFVVTVGAVLVAALIAQRRWYAHLRRAEAVLAWAVLATAGLLAVVVVPGALAILGRGSVVVAALAILGGVWLLARRGLGASAAAVGAAADPWRPARRGGPLVWGAGIAAVAVALIYATAFLIDRRSAALPGVDVLNFGLPMVARWIQQGQIWSVGHYSIYWSFGTYPNNGEAVQALALLPWHSDAFVRFSLVPFMAMSALGTYVLGVRLRAPRPTAMAWAAAVVATPAGLLSALEDTKPDTFMLACFVAGLVFVVRHVQYRLMADLVLGALALGLAFGARWYGLTAVVAVVAVWAGARLVARTDWRTVARHTLIVAGLVALAGGFWLLRNWIEVSNPVFPVNIAFFHAPPDYIRERAGFSIVHYATDTSAWRHYIWPALRNGLGLAAVVGWVACIVAVVALARRPRTPDRALLGVVALAAIVLWLVYAATPYSAQGPKGIPLQTIVNTRYALPALATAAAVAAGLGAWSRRWALASTVLGFLAVLDGVTHVDNAGFLPYLAHVARPKRVVEAIVLLGLVAAAIVVIRLLPRTLRFVAVACVALLVLFAGYRHEKNYIAARYVGVDPAIDAALKLPGRHTIAITGPTPPGILPPNLPLNGPRLDNRVRVLGHSYQHILLPLRSRADMAAALRGEPYDLVYVTKMPGQPSRESQWVQQLGWRLVASTDKTALYRRG